MDELRGESTPKIAGMDERVRRARRKIDREVQQYGTQRSGSWLDLGKSVLGGLLGGKLASRTNVSSARTALRSSAPTAKLTEVLLRPRTSDLEVGEPLLLWRPWRVDAAGAGTAAW